MPHSWFWKEDGDHPLCSCWKCKNCKVECSRPPDKKPPNGELAGTVEGMYTCEEMQVRQVMES
jgi:hypothetical protein